MILRRAPAPVRVVLWALLLAFVLLLLQSAFWTARIPVSLRLVVAAVGVTASFAPGAALVAVAVLAPCAHVLVTTVWQTYPFELAEALVLAFLAGYLWAQRRDILHTPGDDGGLGVPSAAFALVILASCAVHFRTLQLWHDYPLPYASDFYQLLHTAYLTEYQDGRPTADGRGFIRVAALMLEGIALMHVTRTLCLTRPHLARQLLAGLVLAGTVGAFLSLPAPIEFARERQASLWRVLISRRWSSMALPSINTAGSYFLLMGFLGIALAFEARRYVVPGAVAAVAAFGAMWMTGTRSALVAGLVVVGTMGLSALGRRWLGWSTARTVLTSAVAAALVAAALVSINPMNVFRDRVQQSLLFRVQFAETGLRMFASAPLTGVGVGQYAFHYRAFASPELLEKYSVNNAHNYLLWMAAELGVIGGTVFIWILVVASAHAVRNLRASPRRSRLLVLAGLAAFAITCSIGQPLEINTAAFPFWIALGLATAPDPGTSRHTAGRRSAAFAATGLALVAFVLVATLPGRIRAAEANIDFARVTYGFHDSDTTRDDNRPFRWAGPRATFFQSSTISAVDVPLSSQHPATPNGVKVTLWVDGRLDQTVVLAKERWQTIRLRPAAEAWRTSRYWRVDLTAEPIDVPADTPDEHRRIAVGEITAVPAWQLDR